MNFYLSGILMVGLNINIQIPDHLAIGQLLTFQIIERQVQCSDLHCTSTPSTSLPRGLFLNIGKKISNQLQFFVSVLHYTDKLPSKIRWLSPSLVQRCSSCAKQAHLLLSHLVNIEHLTAQGWPSLCWGRFYKTLHVTVLRHLCHGRNEESVGW